MLPRKYAGFYYNIFFSSGNYIVVASVSVPVLQSEMVGMLNL